MSYVNLIMFSSVLPSYDFDDKKKDGKTFNGDNPDELEMFFRN